MFFLTVMKAALKNHKEATNDQDRFSLDSKTTLSAISKTTAS
jgi:hypothetical protein